MVPTNVNHSTRSISVERVVWYSDAVVGIMQTFLAALLVDSLADLALATQGSNKPPDTVVAEWIGDQGSKFLSHCVVFFMLIYLWRRHHELYRHISSLNRGTLWLNSAFLGCVCLVPFSTALVARSHFTGISLAMLYGTLCLALCLQLALLHHAVHTGSTIDPRGTGITAVRIFIGIPAIIAGLAAFTAWALSLFNVPNSGIWASGLLVLGFSVRPIMSHYLTKHPTVQPPEAMKIAQDKKDQVKDRDLSPLATFFAGSSPDRSLLFTDSVYAIALTLMSTQLISHNGDILSADETAAIIRDTFTPNYNLGNFWTFLIIFVFVQVLWLQHVRTFLFVGTIGGRTQWLNSMHLFTIVMLPLLFGLIGAAPYWAVIPWWLASLGMICCVLSLALVNWSCLVFHKERGAVANNALRVSFTEDAYFIYIALIAIAPLGLLAFAIPMLVLKDPVVNAMWHVAGAPRRSVREVLVGNPNNGVGHAITKSGFVVAAAFVVICIGIEIVRSNIWLLHPIG